MQSITIRPKLTFNTMFIQMINLIFRPACKQNFECIGILCFLIIFMMQILFIPITNAATPPAQNNSNTAALAKNYGQFFETRDIASLLPMVDKQTLVIFDIDNIIFRTKTLFGSPEWAKHLIHQEMNKGLSREMCFKKCYPVWMKAQKYADIVLMDKRIVLVLKEVRKKSYGFIGFTSRQPAAAEITEWQLNKFGIDFSLSNFSLFSFISSFKHPTLFRQGILFSNDHYEKGIVFANWMEQIRAQINKKNAITRIIVIDDKEKNLHSMAKAAQSLGLEFIGLRYSAIDTFKKTVNPELIEKEKEILMNNLSDSETWLFLENAGSYKGGIEGPEQEE